MTTIQKIKLLVTLSFAGLLPIGYVSGPSSTFSVDASINGPPAAHSGAPGELSCTDCHSTLAATGTFSVVAPAAYTPGQTYQIQVRHVTSDATRKRWGFELTALAGTAMAGSFTNTGTFTRTITGGSRTYIEHTSTGTFQNQTGGATWTFNWTAPASNVGTVTMYAAGIQANNNGSESGDQPYTRSVAIPAATPVAIHHGFADFDGDGKADASVFRPSSGMWYINGTNGLAAYQWGLATDKLAPADYDGDDKTDIAVWRPDVATQAAFYIFQSSTSTVRIEPFGQNGDDPTVVADWDGDGKADPAVYRDSAFGTQSYFYYRGSLNNPSGGTTFLLYGRTGDRAIRGDFDGDGRADMAVFRPSNGLWYINQSSTNTVRYEYWGLATDKFVPADYDGDGKTDLAVFRAGVWYLNMSTAGVAYYQFGSDGDILAPADYDGDGKTDIAIYRGGNWWIRSSSTSNASVVGFGVSSDLPVPAAFIK